MTLIDKWHQLFPNDKPSESPSAVAGGTMGVNTQESSLRGDSAWHEDGWSESSPHPVKGDVEMVDLGNIFVRDFYRSNGNTDSDLDGLINFMNFRKERPGPVKDNLRPKIDKLLRLGRTGEGKAVRGEYRVPDRNAINSWQNFNHEALHNSGGIQTSLL